MTHKEMLQVFFDRVVLMEQAALSINKTSYVCPGKYECAVTDAF